MSDPPPRGQGKLGVGQTPYLGNVSAKPTQKPVTKGPNAGKEPVPVIKRGTIKAPFGSMTVTTEGYKKGDQVKLLPPNGQKLADVQEGLYAAGYISKAEYKRMVLGSPDEVTTKAFAKLLATANMSGNNWRDTLAQRLADAAAQAPADEGTETPPLTIALSDPEAIKQTLNATARKLLGGYMTPEQTDAFVAQFQAQQTAQQTAVQNQKYIEGVGYGPGGTTIEPDMKAQAELYAKTTDPNQYKATQFGSQVHQQLESLRSTGYLSNQENNL